MRKYFFDVIIVSFDMIVGELGTSAHQVSIFPFNSLLPVTCGDGQGLLSSGLNSRLYIELTADFR